MEKKITIEMNNEEISFKTEGFNKVETLGLLRLYEQRVSLDLLQMEYEDKTKPELPSTTKQ